MSAAATETWDVKRLLEWTTSFFQRRGLDSPRFAAEMLLAHVLGMERIRLYTNFNRPVAPAELAKLRELVRRAGEHEPVQYLVEAAHFFSLELRVTPAVLIPRPETETLVESALRRLKLANVTSEPLRILDLCTGSGAIALALAKQLPAATVVASDISADAAAIARENAKRLELSDRVEVREGDLFAVVTDEPPFDLVTANPPYIPTGDLASLDRNVRDYEPHLALDGGADGLDIVRRLLSDGPRYVKPGGAMYLELQFDQGPRVAELAREVGGWSEVKVIPDLSGHDRVVMVGRGQ